MSKRTAKRVCRSNVTRKQQRRSGSGIKPGQPPQSSKPSIVTVRHDTESSVRHPVFSTIVLIPPLTKNHSSPDE